MIWLVVVLGYIHAQMPSARAEVSFDRLLEETGLVLKKSADFEEIRPPSSSLFAFEKAFRHKEVALEVWYAVRPIARVEIKYSDPHSSAPNPDHIFPMIFQAMVGQMATHGHSPSRVYPVDIARALFNADWAAATLFDTDPALGTDYALGLLVAIHGNGKGDGYMLFLFDDGKTAKPPIDRALGLLRFGSE